MSVAVVSPASSTAVARQPRGAASSAAQAYAALQQDATQKAGQVAHHHRGKASAKPSGSAAQASAAKPNTGGGLNILA